jgi:PAS domain-containing protein
MQIARAQLMRLGVGVLLTGIFVAVLPFTGISVVFLQQFSAFLVVTILFVLFGVRNRRPFFLKHGVSLLFLSSTLLILLIITSTGGFASPFFMLIHFFVLGSALLLSFRVAVIFYFTAVGILFFSFLYLPRAFQLFEASPLTVLLDVVSLLLLLPIAYELSRRYRSNDALSKSLLNLVKVQDVILSNIEELVFVTDKNFSILSMNSTAERVLRRSASELSSQNFFDVVLLRRSSGLLRYLDASSQQKMLVDKERVIIDNVKLISPGMSRVVSVHMTPILTVDGSVEQLSVLITNSGDKEASSVPDILDATGVVYVAAVDGFERLLKVQNKALIGRFLLLSRIGEDMLYAHELEVKDVHRVLFDFAQLCKRTVVQEKDFASAFECQLQFSIDNFGVEDVRKLAHDYPVNPEEVTGPFFTVSSDVRRLGILLQKLLDIAVLLSSTESGKTISVHVKRAEGDTILVSIVTSSPEVVRRNHVLLLTDSSKRIIESTNLRLGSHLEGYLVQLLSQQLGVKVMLSVNEENKLVFAFSLPVKNSFAVKS